MDSSRRFDYASCGRRDCGRWLIFQCKGTYEKEYTAQGLQTGRSDCEIIFWVVELRGVSEPVDI